MGFDGDSDRIGIVDENGDVLYGDELMIIYSRAILKEYPSATILSEVKSSHRLYQDIANRGGRPIMWKTGHSLIKSKMKEENALLAGEMSGHIFFADRYYGYDDAIYAAIRLYEILMKEKVSVSEMIADLPKTLSTPEIRIDCEDEAKFKIIEKAKQKLSEKFEQLNTIDGVRVDLDHGWGLLRASNTQPVIVARFEATTQEQLDELKTTFRTVLTHVAENLKTSISLEAL